MTLTKQSIDVSFAMGLDTKSDPKRVAIGKFVQLENTVFDKGGLLQKRNGYPRIGQLPVGPYTSVTTFNDNLTAIGQNVAAYSAASDSFVEKGAIQPMTLSALPVIRNNLNQTACDIAVHSSGNACAVYLESDGSTTTAKFVVFDVLTGQNVRAPGIIPVGSGTVTGGLRVFTLGNKFIIVFTNVITAVNHLQYVAVNAVSPEMVTANTDIVSVYTPATTVAWDACVAGSNLYIAYNNTAGGQSVKVTYLSSSLSLAAAATFSGEAATMMSVTADNTVAGDPVIYASYYDAAANDGYVLAVDDVLGTLLSPTQVIASGDYLNITSAAQNGEVTIFAEADESYTFDATIPTHYVAKRSVTIAGVVSAATVSIRSVGLASKAFIIDGVIYYLSAFDSPYQPSYFLVNGSDSSSASPVISAKLAYSDGGGYLTTGLPNAVVDGSTVRIPYLFKDLVQAVNKNTNPPAGSQVDGIYSQTGVNLATFVIGAEATVTAEIANNLHLSGGLLWMYDGYLPVEHGFLVYPDTDIDFPSLSAVWSATGGSIVAQPDGSTNDKAYWYQFTYEWTDNQGNAHKSAPSLPTAVTTTGTGSAGSITLSIPTLRVTMKTANPVKIVIYRWSVAQQIYYQVTSITSPLLNDSTIDEVQFVDTLADASILGNNIIYTTGGVLENTPSPATNAMTLFDTRLWTIDAEDQNVLYFSKPVIQAVPVEMTDLQTIYVPPTASTQGPTGPMRAIGVMDDKLVIGKENALLYINGSGPDITGVNSQYSPPIFITSTVGCTNQKSMVLQPNGLMFESNKGIWLLGRDLATTYIGAPVQDLTLGATVLSAVAVPETNQVRFVMSTGITLMYDYYYDQWGSFTGVSAISSCIYDDAHTILTPYGTIQQQSTTSYLDGSSPVNMRFKTGPLRLGDLQAYQRAYFFYLLGTYISPHRLTVNLYFDYEASPSQSVVINPINTSQPFGAGSGQSPFGQQEVFGGPSTEESWRVFLEKQRCMAFAIEIQESYDPSYGIAAGAGLTLSGLNVVCGMKKGYRPQDKATSVG
jgi:hypothetical protein